MQNSEFPSHRLGWPYPAFHRTAKIGPVSRSYLIYTATCGLNEPKSHLNFTIIKCAKRQSPCSLVASQHQIISLHLDLYAMLWCLLGGALGILSLSWFCARVRIWSLIQTILNSSLQDTGLSHGRDNCRKHCPNHFSILRLLNLSTHSRSRTDCWPSRLFRTWSPKLEPSTSPIAVEV